jgi:hypothetical protein
MQGFFDFLGWKREHASLYFRATGMIPARKIRSASDEDE